MLASADSAERQLERPTSVAEHAARENWTCTDFLVDLVAKERQSRSQSRIARMMRNSNLLAGKTWEEFKWSRLPLHVTRQEDSTDVHPCSGSREDGFVVQSPEGPHVVAGDAGHANPPTESSEDRKE